MFQLAPGFMQRRIYLFLPSRKFANEVNEEEWGRGKIIFTSQEEE